MSKRFLTASAVAALVTHGGVSPSVRQELTGYGGAAGSGKTDLAAARSEPAGTRAVEDLARRQANQRAKWKAAHRQERMKLREAEAATIVLAHIHPRWLRRMVEWEMNHGAMVTEREIATWRAQGPQAFPHMNATLNG